MNQFHVLTDAELETKWRGLCENKLRQGADQKEFEDCWFESCNRNLGILFTTVYRELKEAYKVEQLRQIERVQALGVK